ncbi:PAS domain-containing protein [Stakelama saccharophila]|uniref:histidine kinase n=1 Tax=Stakelama saccharophila TaxID=3075605 RepID=A0ABZ0B923_9SPHN|nr:PAS domain-containing protein [Stakelama sp. W311]WNO53894.1 PAS domain-containing protein [Stakelama sp. W311]
MFSGLGFLDHPGEMPQRIREKDWSGTPLGPIEQWPQALRFALNICMGSSFPTAVYWGPDLILLYNDAWAPIPADRHPWALGRPAREVWGDIWSVIEPQVREVWDTARGFAGYDEMLPMERDGVPHETYWNYSFTPIKDEYGRVAGILNQGNETTRTVMAERQRTAQIERFSEFVEQAPGAIAVLHGPTFVCQLANSAYRELVGNRPIVGKPIAEALPEVAAQGFVDLLNDVYRTGKAYRGDGVVVELDRQGDGPDRRILDFVYQPITDANGEVTDIFVEANDVTEKLSALDALRMSTEAQTFVYSLAERQRGFDTPAAIMRFTSAALGRRLKADRVGFFRAGRDGEIAFGPCWTTPRLPPLKGTMPRGALGEGARREYGAGHAVVVRDAENDPDDGNRPVAWSSPAGVGVPLLRGGQWVASLYVSQAEPRDWSADDITFIEAIAEITWDAVERVEAVAALRESEEKFRVIANSIEQIIWSTRPDGYHDYYNDRWYEFTGVPRDSTDGDGWKDVFHPDDRARALEQWRHCLETGEPYHIEYRLRHRSGVYRWVLGRAQPMHDASGRIVRWYGTCTDIQEIVDARDVLTRSREELEDAVEQRSAQLMAAEDRLRQAQKMEAIGQLTGGIAHDFNNMLAVVLGALDLIDRRSAQGGKDMTRYVEAAREGATRAAALTRRLLDFARKTPLAPRAVDVNELIGDMLDLLRRTIGEGVAVATAFEDAAWYVTADPGQLENSIINLAVNARDAMPDGGTVSITTANRRLGEGDAGEWDVAPGDYVEIAVSDTGIGMPPDVAERAFEPFFTTKEVGKGTGLGLSQIFGFVGQSGGQVRIDSEPGSGTTVRILLPRDGDAARPRSPEREQAQGVPHSRGEETVLLVEDEDRLRTFSAEALRELGYAVIEAANGAQALNLLRDGAKADLLLTDVVMPGMTGRELADRAIAMVPGLKLLYASGYTRDAIQQTGGLSATAAVLPKPFGVEALAAAVRDALDADPDAATAKRRTDQERKG